MKRSILLCNKNYWSSKGTVSEDAYILNQEGQIFHHRIPENLPSKRWKKYLKSQPKSKREGLEKTAIRHRAVQFRKYEKSLKYKKYFRTNVSSKNETETTASVHNSSIYRLLKTVSCAHDFERLKAFIWRASGRLKAAEVVRRLK